MRAHGLHQRVYHAVVQRPAAPRAQAAWTRRVRVARGAQQSQDLGCAHSRRLGIRAGAAEPRRGRDERGGIVRHAGLAETVAGAVRRPGRHRTAETPPSCPRHGSSERHSVVASIFTSSALGTRTPIQIDRQLGLGGRGGTRLSPPRKSLPPPFDDAPRAVSSGVRPTRARAHAGISPTRAQATLPLPPGSPRPPPPEGISRRPIRHPSPASKRA